MSTFLLSAVGGTRWETGLSVYFVSITVCIVVGGVVKGR